MHHIGDRPHPPEILTLDLRGQICPSTLLTALRELNRRADSLKTDRVRLRIVTDNRESTATIPHAAENMGYVSEVAKEGGAYVIVVHAANASVLDPESGRR